VPPREPILSEWFIKRDLGLIGKSIESAVALETLTAYRERSRVAHISFIPLALSQLYLSPTKEFRFDKTPSFPQFPRQRFVRLQASITPQKILIDRNSGKFRQKTENKVNGADGGGRTHTLSRVLDFESSASANSATSAHAHENLQED
jgi:hypothetical protein